MAKIVDKMLSLIGFEEVPYEEKKYGGQYTEDLPVNRDNRKGSVVNIHTQRRSYIIVIEPHSHDEVQGIADHLKNRSWVIVNLENVDVEIARRVVDFMSGTTYALDGCMQKVGTGIFVFVPSNQNITAVIRDIQKDINHPRF